MRGSKVALVLEDEPIIRDCMVQELQDRGWTVMESDKGEEAVAISDAQPLDIVLTDIQLAGDMSGWDVADRVRMKIPDMPIIYMSARPRDDRRQLQRSLFFDKPYDTDAVANACERLVDGRA
jgi:CheY-like chemotaxis protein